MRTAWLAILAFGGSASAADNRLILIDQSDFGAKLGFYLSVEAKGEDGTRIPLSATRLILGVADGSNWRFLSFDPHLAIGANEVVDAEITNSSAILKFNGAIVAIQDGGFKPIAKAVTAALSPDWASAPAEYRLVQDQFSVRSVTDIGQSFTANPAFAALSVFEKAPPATFEAAALTVPIKLHAVFHIEAPSTSTGNKGLVDRFGQAVAAEWSGKLKLEADFVASIRSEASHTSGWQRPAALDPFGGTTTAWHEAPTGFFSTIKRNGYWWLVSPQGNPLFYTGLCTAPALKWDVTPVSGREGLWTEPLPREGLFSELWARGSWGDSRANEYFASQSANLVRKFGAEWKSKATQELQSRLTQWGFSGEGKWSDTLPHTVNCPVLHIDAPRIGRHFDIFDPAVTSAIRESLRRQIESEKGNPWILGWSIGNEFDEIITTEEVTGYLKLDDSHPVRNALTKYLSDSGFQATNVEAARRFYARAYYGLLYKTVKEIDTNHLYFGFWIVPNWWQNEEDWSLIAPYCDVIGYDRYAPSYKGIENLLAKFDKPTLLGEFSFPAWYGGGRGFGRYNPFVETDKESGERYRDVLRLASLDPKCVGAFWFQYRDEPITGRGPGSGPEVVYGEHYAFGMVDCTDRAKWDLVDQVRETNLSATPARLMASN